MQTPIDGIKVISFNVKGLNNLSKRKTIINELKYLECTIASYKKATYQILNMKNSKGHGQVKCIFHPMSRAGGAEWQYYYIAHYICVCSQNSLIKRGDLF